MNFYQPRKLKFKAWNTATGLMMRLNAIECVKGELVKKDHILLQFTGLLDQQADELYELDVIMMEGERYCVVWGLEQNGWCIRKLESKVVQPFSEAYAKKAVRLWSYMESARNG